MTPEQREKYDSINDKLSRCKDSLALNLHTPLDIVGVQTRSKDSYFYNDYLLPKEVCSEIKGVILSWINHYEKEIEKI